MNSSSDAGDPQRGIYLERLGQAPYAGAQFTGFRFQVSAYGASRMPNEVFLFRAAVANPLIGAQVDVFECVCSPVDLEDYPVGAPNPTEGMPFFRNSQLDLVFRSQAQALEGWQLIQEEVTALVATLNSMDQLVTREVVVVGDPPPADPPANP